MSKALLFINGKAPQSLPDTAQYDLVMATDGAYNYLENSNISIDVLIGDLDSVLPNTSDIKAKEILEEYNQDYTDFQKALNYLKNKAIQEVDVYGGTGKEQDHFLGNLSAALEFKSDLKITFYEDQYSFWLLNTKEEIHLTQGKIVSLFPFPWAKNIVTQGLQYPLHHEDLEMGKRIGIRNTATEDTVKISFEEGEMWVFVYF